MQLEQRRKGWALIVSRPQVDGDSGEPEQQFGGRKGA